MISDKYIQAFSRAARPLPAADQRCRACEQFFARFQCGAAVYGECDCPKCQGYCECNQPGEEDSNGDE